ncbi:MAG: response regulator [Opitutaceae bacterium]|nr:response regulator [Opitutaceae bacterium]
MKFTSAGKVEIRGRVTDDHSPLGLRLSFAVSDTGVGIPEEARARMFKPYSQAESSTTRQYGGTGLGLAICKQLCLLMHGDIDFKGNQAGGTTFEFHIRLGRGDPSLRPYATPLLLTPGEWHCFIVEPRSDYGNFLKEQISQWGMSSTHVTSLEAMPNALNAVTVNSILIILGLDERSHPGAQALLREAAAGRQTKIILHVQTHHAGASSAKVSEGGYDAFVPQPLRTGQLARTLVTLLGRSAPVSEPSGADIVVKSSDASGPLILVVEDNRLNQKVILKMLRNLGYRYELAVNGAEAVDFATRISCNLILMDWHMPVMDGLDATRQIRRLGDPYATLPIIALTASALHNEREQCFSAGMNDYLSKPLTEKNLKAKLQKWLADRPVLTG